MAYSIFEAIESEVRSYSRAFPVTFSKAIGSEIWSTDGRKYIDFLAGCGSLNYGHNPPALKEPLINYIANDSIAQGLDMQTASKERLLQAMSDIILRPRGLDYVVQFTGPTGTNAVESAMKLARKVTGRTNIVCFTNGYHGVSLGALAATGNQYNRGAAGVPLTGTTFMPYDGYMDGALNSLGYFSHVLNDKSSGLELPAAVLVETVQGEGGLNAASNFWLKKLEKICKKHEILLIVDDIQAGCGRTGTFFSFEPAGITPDIVTLSKSFSGFGLPLSAVLIKRSLDQWKPAEHNGTFRGNNHAFVTATAAIETYWKDTELTSQIASRSERIGDWLTSQVNRYPDDITKSKGRGMMRGLQCADPEKAAGITRLAFEQGLIVERSGPEDEVIKLLMPITTPEALLDEGLEILEDCCRTIFGHYAIPYSASAPEKIAVQNAM